MDRVPPRKAGIGLALEQTMAGTLCYVADIQPGGSAALHGGVEIGDKILSIDKESVAGLSLSEVGMRMGGPEGTYVTLGLVRTRSMLFGPDSEEHVQVTVCRGQPGVSGRAPSAAHAPPSAQGMPVPAAGDEKRRHARADTRGAKACC